MQGHAMRSVSIMMTIVIPRYANEALANYNFGENATMFNFFVRGLKDLVIGLILVSRLGTG